MKFPSEKPANSVCRIDANEESIANSLERAMSQTEGLLIKPRIAKCRARLMECKCVCSVGGDVQ